MRADLEARYKLLHGADTEAARAELARVRISGREVVVVSACMLGVRCRFDGRDKLDEAAVARLGDVEILPLCPEVLARFGVPRPAITLHGNDLSRARDSKGRDVTQALESGARLADLFATEADAKRALLKERSPSCGVSEVHGESGVVAGQGRFTARLRKRGLPVISEK